MKTDPPFLDGTLPRISIVIPVFNAERYIGEALSAVAAQDFRDFEVHVVDDCSSDGSASIIKDYCARDARFFYHLTSTNFGGPANPRNLGISVSIGEYVAFCDADDIWVPHKLSVQIAVADRTGAAVVSALIRDFADGDPVPNFQPPIGEVAISEISHRRLLIKNWIALSSVMVRRTVLLETGPFNAAKTHIAVEDFDMWLRITQRGGRVVRLDVPLVHYRKVSTSISANKSTMVQKALKIIGEDYSRRERKWLFRMIQPLHWLAYVGSAAWHRAVRKEL